MKKIMVTALAWVMIFDLGGSGIGWADRASQKLINPEDIMIRFKQCKDRIKVIVGLIEPAEIKDKISWKSEESVRSLRVEIANRQASVLSSLTPGEFTLRHRYENLPGFSGEITVGGLDKLLDNPLVVSVEPDRLEYALLAQGTALINGTTYRSTYNGSGIAIAISDTGVDYTHARLGNGSLPNSKVIGGYDFGDGDSDPMPNGNAHGTACAGIAAGDLGTVGDYIGGVAYNSKIYALKISHGSTGSAWDSDVIDAWDWCITNQYYHPDSPIMVISHSFGGGRYFSSAAAEADRPFYAAAADRVITAGITLLAASGNDGYCSSLNAPAAFSSIISVGAVYDAGLGTYDWCVSDSSCAAPGGTRTCDSGEFSTRQTSGDDIVTVYSNTASFLDILAPSHCAYTTDIVGSGGYSTVDYDSCFGGTSAACPYAAGAVACLQEAAMDLTGDYLTPDQVRATLVNTGDNIADGKVAITKPRVNLEAAIQSLGGENNDPFLYNGWVSPQSGTTVTDFEYTVNYHDVDGDVPNYVRVYIDGNPHDMTLWNGTAASGEYLYVTQLSSGSHNYYFTTTDIRGGYRQTVSYTGPNVDVPPSGSFDVLDYTADDSPSILSSNNGDGIFQSGEKVNVRPRIQFNGIATATDIGVALPYDGSNLEVPTGDRNYPDLNPGETGYPKNNRYFQIEANLDYTGIEDVDVQIEWEEEDVPHYQLLSDGLSFNVQPAAWIWLSDQAWDFGVTSPGDNVIYTLTVTNIGTDVLQVTNIDTSSEDTVANPTSFALNPGNSRNVEITIYTSGLEGQLSRDIHVISNGRTYEPAEDEHLIISGLVSDKVPIFQVPNVTAGDYPDISVDYIVWKDGRNENSDIFAYNIRAGTELQITTNPSTQYEPLISGDLIVWTDARNWDGSGWTPLYDIYGYDLSTGQEFVISDDPEKEILIGVDGNLVAFARAYEILEDWVEKQIAYNLLVYEYQGNGQFIQRYTTGFVPGSGYQTRQSIHTDGDFGGGLLVFESYEWYWDAEDEYWLRGDKHVEVFDFLAGDTNPHRELNGWYDPYSATTHRFAFVDYYEDPQGYSGDQVWIWDNGSVRRITSPGSAEVDHGGDCLAISADLIVYDKWAADALFYWDLSTEQEFLLTNEVNNAYDSRMDDNTVVWEAEGHIYFAFVQTPDIEVSPANIAFSDEHPIEDDTIDISAVIRNVADYDCTQDITVRLYDGDPNDPNTQLCSDEIISGGIGARGNTIVEFNDISVGVEGSHNIYACINVSFIDNPLNNKAYKTLIVGDADTQGPEISNVVVQEFNGNGDGRIENDEQIFISWQATDLSGINSSWCTIDSNDYPASGTYYVILPPRPLGIYGFSVSATDGDISPETTQQSDSFMVSFHGDISEDNKVNFEDLKSIADQWLQPPGTPSADIAPSPVDGFVNFLDFAILAKDWLSVAP